MYREYNNRNSEDTSKEYREELNKAKPQLPQGECAHSKSIFASLVSPPPSCLFLLVGGIRTFTSRHLCGLSRGRSSRDRFVNGITPLFVCHRCHPEVGENNIA